MQSLLKTLLGYFSSLSAGKKIGLLALLVILLALPLSLTALRQRQETRKKAAEELSGPTKPEVVFGKVVVRFQGPVRNQGYRARFEEEDGTADQLSLLKQRLGVTEEKPLQLEQKPARVDPGRLRVQSEEEAEQTKNDTIEVLTYSADADPFGVARQFENLAQVAWAEPVFIYHATQEATEAGSQPTVTEPQTSPLGGETASPIPTPTSSQNPTVCSYPSPPDDTYYCSGDQWALEKIHAWDAWQVTTGSDSVIVAVVDTGVDYNHPDLNDNVVLPGKDFVNNDDDPMDDVFHGTHVAGIIGAIGNNNRGITGINWKVKVLPVKVMDSSGGYTYTIAEGISWAVAHGARIINLSLGGPGESQLMTEVINDAYRRGVTVVAAAGNSSRPAEDFFPASNPHVIAVAATAADDSIAHYSNYGSTIKIAAPGGDVPDRQTSCTNLTCILSTFPNNRHEAIAGTSMAAPYVSGLAALVLAKQPTLTPDQIEAVLEHSADDLGEPGWDPYYGWGRINAAKALQAPDTSQLPYIKWLAPGSSGIFGQVINFTVEIRGDARVEQAQSSNGPWSEEGIALVGQPTPGEQGQIRRGEYTAPDGYRGDVYLKATTTLSDKTKSAIQRFYVDITAKRITLPFTPSWITVANVNDTPEEEVVAANRHQIAVTTQDGRILPEWPQEVDDAFVAGDIAVGEVDPNYPGKEIVALLRTPYDARAMAWHADGTTVRGFPTPDWNLGYTTASPHPVVADINNDGRDEVIFVDSLNLHVIGENGQEIAGFPKQRPPDYSAIPIPPVIADLDGDGQKEIVALIHSGGLWAVNAKGQEMPGFPVTIPPNNYNFYTRFVAGDLTNSGSDQVVVVNYSDSERGGQVLIFDGRGAIITTRKIEANSNGVPDQGVMIADVAGDHKPEIIISGFEGRLFVLNNKGEDVQSPIQENDINDPYMLAQKTPSATRVIASGYNYRNAETLHLKVYKGDGSSISLERSIDLPSVSLFLEPPGPAGSNTPPGLVVGVESGVQILGQDEGTWLWKHPYADAGLTNRYTSGAPLSSSNSLKKGWNLFGLELNPEQKLVAKDLAERLKSITGDNVAILGFDPGKGQALAHFTDPEKAILNNLEEITFGQGYWVRVEKDAQFELSGTRPTQPRQVAFKTGWQLVSFPYLPDGYDAASFANKLKELTGGNIIIIGFDPGRGQALAHFTDPEKIILNNLDKLEHRKGYWLSLKTDITVKVNPDGSIQKIQ